MHNRLLFVSFSEIQRSFRVLDTDKNGRLSVNELINGLRVIGLNPTQREAKQLIEEVDKSGTGFLLYEDYEKIMIDQMKNRDKEEELFTQAFKKFDRDGNGIIDFKELKFILCRTGDKLTDEEVDEFFQEADQNHDGKINYTGIRWPSMFVNIYYY
ncbi:hypothetical protein FSP39_010002 [Pinctada imbricata]|uniref:Sulfhydryl light chain n=1 Tax=Pinctada imbricata TaxID=66713 RepID=A0AA88Y206_PINIB|nr:hypothetical protein FSP39_010002 [Pinctada imbricata]